MSPETIISLPIAEPPWLGLGKRLEKLCRKALFQFNMLEGVSNLAIALSGGKDSLSLLFLLKAISGRGFPKFDIHAIHITGEFSCGSGVNIEYLEAICKKLNVNFITRTSNQKLDTLECYSCSRERRSLIFEAAKSVGAKTIAFGHHQDDNAQTVLMNLFQKAEFAGMLPKIFMHHYDVTIIRPLIYASQEDLLAFAQKNKFARITCQCPVGQTSMRKKVDLLLSEIADLFPHVRQNIANAGLLFGSDKARNILKNENKE